VAIGPVELGQLQKGKARELTADEKQQMDRSLSDAALQPKRTRYRKYE